MKSTINKECTSCPIRLGCHTLVAFHPLDVLEPPCGKYVIGLAGNCDDSTFWTIPKDKYIAGKDQSDIVLFCIS